VLASSPRAAWRLQHADPKLAAQELPRNAADLDALEAKLKDVQRSDVRVRLAFGSRQSEWWRAFSSVFTHAGWEHIVFNLWFLWVIGIPLEDRWGRVIFPLFHLAGGVVANLLQWQAAGGLGIGASGAIAAVMGAAAVQLAGSKLHLMLITLFPIGTAVSGRYGRIVPLIRIPPLGLVIGRFAPPAWLPLFAWGGFEIWFGATEFNSGVGHWAHVGGFVFGVVVAALFRITNFDRFVDATVERSGASVQHPELMAAAALIDEGRPGIAILRLRKLLDDRNFNPIDVQLELLRAAEKAGSKRDEANARVALLEIYAKTGGPALELYRETVSRGFASSIPEALRAAVLKPGQEVPSGFSP
jgi:membrane associated rhomboid family serine protease